jgi:diguanylate cyclase (GGDEF)-like protein
MRKRITEMLFSKWRLIGVLSIVLLCTFTFTSYLSFKATRDSITKITKTETLPLISDNIYSEIQQELINPINNSSLMANDAFLVDWIENGETDVMEIQRYLSRIKDRYGYFSAFYISDTTHNYYYYDGILKQISPEDEHDVWYYKFLESGVDYEFDVDADEATAGTLTIFINHRLENQDGRLLGVTGVGLEMDSVGKMLRSYQERFGPLTYMIDAQGLIQVHPDVELVEKVRIQDLAGISSLSDEILSNKSGTHIYEYTNQAGDIVISARYFPDLEWILIVEQNQTVALRTALSYFIGNVIIGAIITALVILVVALTINLFYSKLEVLAVNDELTGIYNRRKFCELFQREISLARRYDQPLSLLLIDVDRFKSVNDSYGHPTGDRLLKKLAEVLQQHVREIDVVGRWGGEEFVTLLHNTAANEAYQVAERLREAVSRAQFETGKDTIAMTVSIGVAAAPPAHLTLDEMVHLADEAMYAAKAAGRNKTKVSGQH